jgi:dTDP-4-amino-4,6-dideoxygalactose transaminase
MRSIPATQKPCLKRRIPYCVPSWGWNEHLAIVKSLLSGCIVSGPPIQSLYEEVRALTGVTFVFGFESGASAIQACLQAVGVGSGDRVIMPSFCCHSVAEAILGTGAAPLFCDIQKDLNPDVGSIIALLTPSVKAIVFPHLFGRPGDIQNLEEELCRLGVREQVVLIDDAAQSFGARIDGRWLGTFGDAGIISFGAGKMTTASGGGLLVTQSEKIARQVERLAVTPPPLFGKLRDLTYWTIFRRWRRYSIGIYPYVGFLFRKAPGSGKHLRGLAAIDAAIASCQVHRLEKLIRQRGLIRQQLERILVNIRQDCRLPIEQLEPAAKGHSEAHNKHIFFFDSGQAAGPDNGQRQFYTFFKHAGIELQPLYAPLHRDSRYGRQNTGPWYADERAGTAFNLCTDPTLLKKDIAHIGAILKDYFHKYHFYHHDTLDMRP